LLKKLPTAYLTGNLVMATSPKKQQPITQPDQERGERLDTGRAIARGGKTTGEVPGATAQPAPAAKLIQITAGEATLEGNLTVPADAHGLVLFAHGSGSSRHSPRNRFVAAALNEHRVGTLLLDLLSGQEESADAETGHLRFDIELLADRVRLATEWLQNNPMTRLLPIGYFGASTGAAAALVAAAQRPGQIHAVVSRGGRPDLAGQALPHVVAPTLLIVGGDDVPVIGLNQAALNRLGSPRKELAIVPGATHLFEESGTLDEVARLASGWFVEWLPVRSSGGASHGS
jgi:putative phosphoribosyl transferase